MTNDTATALVFLTVFMSILAIGAVAVIGWYLARGVRSAIHYFTRGRWR